MKRYIKADSLDDPRYWSRAQRAKLIDLIDKSSTQICASYRPVSDPNNLTISELMSRIDMEQPDLWDKAVNYLEKYLDNPEDVWASGYPDWEAASWGISSDAIVSVLEAALETGAVDDMYTL